MCGQDNVRVSVEDNTGQNTKDTHPIPGQKLKFLTPPGIKPGPPGWKAPTTPRRRHTFYLAVYFFSSSNFLFKNLSANSKNRAV